MVVRHFRSAGLALAAIGLLSSCAYQPQEPQSYYPVPCAGANTQAPNEGVASAQQMCGGVTPNSHYAAYSNNAGYDDGYYGPADYDAGGFFGDDPLWDGFGSAYGFGVGFGGFGGWGGGWGHGGFRGGDIRGGHFGGGGGFHGGGFHGGGGGGSHGGGGGHGH
ncbi:MAG: hypothetical protein JWM91_898 [Rhodospirillales bacterium]|nr:hypothetical protein [Rhodospirillales bacterium]